MIAVIATALSAITTLSANVARAQGDLDGLVRRIHQSGCRDGLDALTSLVSGSDLEARRASFLLGWCQTQAARYSAAAAAYRAAAEHPTLRPFARIGEARALARSGNPGRAAALARETVGSGSVQVRARALAALGEIELALKRPTQATEALAAATVLRPSDPELWQLLGGAASAAGRRDLARLAYARAGWAFPDDPVEAAARQALVRLLGRPYRTADIDPESRVLRGKRLARRGEWEAAQAEFRAATVAAATGPIAGEAWYRLGEIDIYADAAAAYQAFRRAAILGWNAAGAWYWAAQAARRAGMTARSGDAVQSLLRVEPKGFWSGRLWLGAGLRAESAGRTADAALYYRRVIEAAPASDDTPEARWRLGWLALRAGRFADAEARFRLAAQTAPWRSAAARAWYWAARTIEASGQTGRADEAARIVRMVAEQYPLTFYGQRARARLALPAPVIPQAIPYVPPREAAAPVYEELFRLGIDVDAAEAGEEAFAAGRDPRVTRFLARVYASLGDVSRSVAMADEALAQGIRDEATWQLAYPRAYWPHVTAAAQAAGIDPLLLISLVREESRYEAGVISPSRAVGLAQLLPSTAQSLTGDSTMTLHRLKDPAVNLRLGARYLRLQLDRFGGDVRLALAAYNAGPGAARRWVGLDDDPDYFVERLPYAETRGYIRRVLGSYGIYTLLW